MFDETLIILGIIGIIGLAIIILGFKFSDKTRKVVETMGSIIFHVGVFGILYHKVNINLFISLVALVISLFILIDPLKIASHLNAKIYRLFGFLTLFAAVAFSLDYFSGFPVWLWAIPLIIYLAPYLISPLKKRQGVVLAIAWLVIFAYIGVIAYAIYVRYSLQTKQPALISELLQDVPPTDGKNDKPKGLKTDLTPITPPPPEPTQTAPSSSPPPIQEDKPTTKKPREPSPKAAGNKKEQLVTGPFFKSLQTADNQYLQLKKKYDALKKAHRKLAKENEALKMKLKELEEKETGRIESF